MADSAKVNYTGRMVVSLQGAEVTAEEIRIIQHQMTCGIILFARNYKDKEQLKQLIGQIQYYARLAGKADMPIFVDQEGGYVQRFGRGFITPLPAPEVIGTTYDIDKNAGLKLAFAYGKKMAEPLMELGVICLGPVLDLDAGNKVISPLGRSFHKDPQSCAELAAAYIAGMKAVGMPATAKHFPGHGQNIGDSHITSPIDPRTLDEIKAKDLIPFFYNMANIEAVMPAHITYPEIDPKNTAGMSKVWLQDILRGECGFNGLVFSDCLAMAGAGADNNLIKTVKAMEYGDISLLCNLGYALVEKDMLPGELANGVIYVKQTEQGLDYAVVDPQGQRVNGTITVAELPLLNYFASYNTEEKTAVFLKAILAITSARWHTFPTPAAEFLTVLDALEQIKEADKKDAAEKAKYAMSEEINARYENLVASSRTARQALRKQYADKLAAREAGAAASGQPLTVASTGLGGDKLATVVGTAHPAHDATAAARPTVPAARSYAV